MGLIIRDSIGLFALGLVAGVGIDQAILMRNAPVAEGSGTCWVQHSSFFWCDEARQRQRWLTYR
jgi:hypothetical protein